MKSIDQRETIYIKSSQIRAYADDIVTISRSREKIINIYKEIEEKAGKIGVEVNERKTKYMTIRRKPQDLKVEGKLFTGVSSFKYLGNIINMAVQIIIALWKQYKLETGLISQILSHLKAK
jgi:hypothetical protein